MPRGDPWGLVRAAYHSLVSELQLEAVLSGNASQRRWRLQQVFLAG